MVKKSLILFFAFYFWLVLMPEFVIAVEVSVVAEIKPIKDSKETEGIITIKRNESDSIDVKSFLLGEKPLEVDLIREMRSHEQNQNVLISIYKFKIPSQPKGLYLLPSISVKINGKTYQSTPVSYEISHADLGNILRLEAIVKPTTAIFPGQRMTFTYKIYFNNNINMTVEELPLLEPKGFQKIGEKEIKDSIENNMNVQEITQEVRALTPGTFDFKASRIEGVAYKIEEGKPVFLEPKLSSETQPIKIQVLPFPEENKPASFNGALGIYTIIASLIDQKQFVAGDEFKVLIEIRGKGDLDTVSIPDLACQPGFSGFFRVSNLPPLVKTESSKKQFILALRPLSSLATELPIIEFSSFDPIAKQYHKSLSGAIPITVKELKIPKFQDGVPPTAKLGPPFLDPWRQVWNEQ